MQSGKETALTATPWSEHHASISPDGSQVVYAYQQGKSHLIELVPLGRGVAEKPRAECGTPPGWAPE